MSAESHHWEEDQAHSSIEVDQKGRGYLEKIKILEEESWKIRKDLSH
jgi:hypothetical protein